MIIIQFFYLLFLSFSQETENEKNFLQLGTSVQGFISPRTQNHKFYIFVVPELKNGTDLIVQLKTLNPNSDPNLYISKSNREPLSIKDADVKACEAKGMDVCVIDNHLIKENDLLYISVVSRFPSRYTLRIELDQEQILKIDSFLTFKMNNEKQSQIIDFEIEEFIYDQTEIELNVQVLNQEQLEEPFLVFMNKYDNGPPSNDKYDYKAIDTWENQKVIEFNQTKSQEKYKILIQGEQGALFRVIATRSESLKTLNQYESVIQVVNKGEYDFYRLENYGNFDCDIGIRLTPFKGYAKLYVHYNSQPPLLESYEWQDEKQEGEFVYISQLELKNKNITLSNLYIAIVGQELCTYQLKSTCENDFYIFSGVFYQRDIQQSEIIKLRIVDDQNENHQIQINLNTLRGVVNFLITNCEDQVQCPLSEELFTNQLKYEKIQDYTMIYSNQKQQTQFVLNCQNWCVYYLIAIVDKNSKQYGRFSIQYKIIEKTMNLLSNTPHKSTVMKDEYQYYKFFVSDQDELLRLHFLVTSIQGDVSMYLSTTNQQPNKENFEFQSKNNSINFGGRYGTKPQSGTYYLSIYGESFSKYMITVWTIKNFEDFRQLGRFPWHYIQLYQGDAHENYLYDDEFVLYKIDMKGYSQQNKDSINVVIQKTYGQLQMFGFDHPETDETKAIWQSGQIITILMDDPYYPEILYLKIKLIGKESNSANFRIAFYSFYQTIDLMIDEPFFNFLPANYFQSFKYEYQRKENFVISKRSFEFDQTSLIFDFEKPSGLEVRFSKNNNSFIVEQIQDNYCLYQSKICSEYFYFSIHTKLDQFYSILISKINLSQVQLKEDQPISKTLPRVEDYFYLYCYGEEVNVIAFTYYGELIIYASIVQTLDSPEANKNNHNKISKKQKIHSQASIYFSQSELQKHNCNDKCIIKLTVVVSEEYYTADINSEMYDYTIQLNSKLILLRESEVQEGTLKKDEFKFYKLRIYNNDNDKNLMIMLKPDINCDADLFVSKSEYPNLDRYDWGSFDYWSDSLIIEPGNNLHPNLTGDYYVGVHGYQECQFVIQYHLGKIEAYDIFQNQPFKFYVKEDYTVYFRVYSFQQTTPFMIFVQSLSETAYFFVDEVEQASAKFSSFQKDVTQFKYNNSKKGYQKRFVTDPLNQDSVLIIALRTMISEIVTIQVSCEETQIYLESQTLIQYILEQNQNVTFIINPNQDSLSTQFQIHLFSGSISCEYSFEKFFTNENQIPIHLLNIDGNNYENQFNITNQENSNLKIHIEAIYSSYFSIQYFNENEENNYIYSIYPQYLSLKSQSEKQFQFINYDYSPLSSNLKTFSISVQIQEDWNALLANQKHRSPPIITVYSNTSQQQIQPIQQLILSNLIYNEYIQTDNQYKIVLKNQEQFEQQYQISVGTSDLRLLLPKIKQLGTIQFHQSTYWVLWQKSGYLFYQMQFCNGIFSVLAGQYYESLLNDQYDLKLDIRQKSVHGYLEKIEYAEMIFLKFDFIKQLNTKIPQAQYTIRVYQVEEKNDIPYDQFFPGFQGYLSSNITKNNDETINLLIQFSPLQFVNKDEQESFEVKKIEYSVILSEGNENDDVEINYCSEPQNENRIIRNLNDNDTYLTFNLTLPTFRWQIQRNFVFNILATVDLILYRDDQRVSLDYYYESQRVKWNSQQMMIQEEKPFNYQIIGISIAVILLIFAIIALIRMKKQRIISKYENSEIRVQQIEGIEMHYRGLNE